MSHICVRDLTHDIWTVHLSLIANTLLQMYISMINPLNLTVNGMTFAVVMINYHDDGGDDDNSDVDEIKNDNINSKTESDNSNNSNYYLNNNNNCTGATCAHVLETVRCTVRTLWATHGVTVSMSAFLACHQCYCAGSSLAWGLNFRAVVSGIF